MGDDEQRMSLEAEIRRLRRENSNLRSSSEQQQKEFAFHINEVMRLTMENERVTRSAKAAERRLANMYESSEKLGLHVSEAQALVKMRRTSVLRLILKPMQDVVCACSRRALCRWHREAGGAALLQKQLAPFVASTLKRLFPGKSISISSLLLVWSNNAESPRRKALRILQRVLEHLGWCDIHTLLMVWKRNRILAMSLRMRRGKFKDFSQQHTEGFFSPEVATQMKIEKSELQMTVKLQNDRIEALKVEAAKVTTLEALLEEMGQMKAMPGNTKDVLVENIGKYEKVPGEYNVVEVVFNGLDTPGIAWDYSLIHVANKRLWQGSGPEHDFACARIKNIRAGSMADKSGVLEVGMCVIRVTGLFVLTSKIEDDGVPWETMEVLESDLRPKAVRFIKVRSDMEVGILTALMRHQRALMVENLEKKKLS